MPLGPAPDVVGILTVGSACGCSDMMFQGNWAHDQDYGGSYCPTGVPPSPVEPGDESPADVTGCFVPSGADASTSGATGTP